MVDGSCPDGIAVLINAKEVDRKITSGVIGGHARNNIFVVCTGPGLYTKIVIDPAIGFFKRELTLSRKMDCK